MMGNNGDTRKYQNRLQSGVAVALMADRWFFVVRIEEREARPHPELGRTDPAAVKARSKNVV
jgi:hypothetical protein